MAQFDAAPRQFAPVQPSPEPAPAAYAAPRAIHDILDPPAAAAAPQPSLESPASAPRAAIDPNLPPDHPLEPGTRPVGRVASPSERIAASQNAISEIPAAPREQASSSNFIAAARRAAQAAAAAAAPSADKPKRAMPKDAAVAAEKGASTIGSKIRSLLVGASVVVIVLGTFKMAMNLLDGGSAQPPVASVSEPVPTAPPAAPDAAPSAPSAPAPVMPSMTSPTPIGRQSMNAPAPAAALVNVASADITGTIPAPQVSSAPGASRPLTPVSIPAGERLPDSIGGPVLRNAALKGDASAAYEVGLRFAEGKGVTANYDEAAKWYDRAAQAGVVPAVFRIGTLYEKGLGVKKDLDAARRYYIQAAERGNAKAMHNLAVLEADGGSKGANYKSASQWFRKAAERGVADSQFNLGILYARGIGVEQNLAESYKWFTLAAAQGDADSGRKRDDVAKRLDPQSLAAAKLAIQTFTPEGQPDDAVNVAAPAGGWDVAAAAPATKPVAAKRAAR
jgi:localization factor PodJL